MLAAERSNADKISETGVLEVLAFHSLLAQDIC